MRPGAVKVPGESAIPAGRYRVALTWSNRLQRVLPLLLDVPGFTGVRIHAGNTAADTAGCLLVGQLREAAAVLDSRAALAALLPKLEAAAGRQEPIWIEIEEPAAAAPPLSVATAPKSP